MNKEKEMDRSFDEMLRHSLEGAQLPVPPGVWETVGASVGSTAGAAAKVTLIKWFGIKTLAGILVTGGLIWGGIKWLQTDPRTQQNDNTSLSNPITTAEEITESAPVSGSDNPNTGNSTSAYNPEETALTPQSEFSQPTEIPASADSVQPILLIQEKRTEPEVKIQPQASTPNNSASTDHAPEPESNSETVPVDDTRNAQVPVIPNVFTPYEQDGYNDCFKIQIENEVRFSLQIFDINGKKVFESFSKLECWDGRNMLNGQMSPKGFYTYKLIYELKTGFKKTERGELNLL